MLVIPAIDIKGGKVVRLVKGKFKEKIYSDDPLEVADFWQKEGAKKLHIVDLDGARLGKIKNLFYLEKILDKINIPIEFGGGIRDINTIRVLLKKGVSQVVIGTKAKDEEFLKKIFEYFGSKVIISVDESKGKVFLEGWRTPLNIDTISFINKIKEVGFKEIIYTNIQRDGTLKGADIKRIKEILKTKMKVIVSGGISSLEDMRKLKSLERYGLKGVILGKALYEKKFSLRQAEAVVGVE